MQFSLRKLTRLSRDIRYDLDLINILLESTYQEERSRKYLAVFNGLIQIHLVALFVLQESWTTSNKTSYLVIY